jgi:hypothetical protein
VFNGVMDKMINTSRGFLRTCAVVLLVVGLLQVSYAVAESKAKAQYYRYNNERGIPVIDETIPPEFVAGGYDIITRDGSLIRRVPRQLTEDELKEQGSDAARERLREEEELRLQAWDEMLMLRYSSVEDISAARDRAVRDLYIRISILKSKLMSVKAQIEREQLKAADIERSGRDVPENLTAIIDKLGREIEDTEESIAVRRQEVDEVKASYQRDIDRFGLLMDRVNMRR